MAEALQDLWTQIRQSAAALTVLAAVATSAFTVGATRGHSQLSIREAVASNTAVNAKQDTALRELATATRELAVQTCLLRLEVRKIATTETCTAGGEQ